MEQALIGTVMLKHKWLVRNTTMALPTKPSDRARHLNETHYFGPAVTEPVRYSNGPFGGYIVLERETPDQPVVAIQDVINMLAGIDLIITGENAGHWTGNENNDYWTRNLENGVNGGHLDAGLAAIIDCVTILYLLYRAGMRNVTEPLMTARRTKRPQLGSTYAADRSSPDFVGEVSPKQPMFIKCIQYQER